MLANIKTPINPVNFVKTFSKKYNKWGNIITKELEDTWKQNCMAFNEVIANKDKSIKYVVSAPTGTAKTENTITYCALLPKEIKVLISTNLTDEADRLATAINTEANDNRAISYHSKKKINLKDTLNYQIVIVSHELYRRHHNGSELWQTIGENKDLIIIDEALDTIDEFSVSISEIEVTYNFFTTLYKTKYKGVSGFEKDYINLTEDINSLEDLQINGKSTLISQDEIFEFKNKNGQILWDIPINTLILNRYRHFINILEKNSFNYCKILTTIKDSSKNKQLKEMLLNTLETFFNLYKRQAYITSNKGEYSLHRVQQTLSEKSLVCFDATADVNATYKLRSKFHNDIVIIQKIPNVRNYSNVDLHVANTVTGSNSIDLNIISSCLKNIVLGKKTLIVSHKSNLQIIEKETNLSYYSKYHIDIINWGAITGLNKWQDYDTCVVIGLNHKPVSYVQNRVLANTNENEAFGSNQTTHYNNVQITNLVAEIIQAINRIRIRKVIDNMGNCDTANIYLTLPSIDYELYKNEITKHMTGINIIDWNLPTDITINKTTHTDSVISYLLKNLNIGDKIEANEPRDLLGINDDSYKNVLGKTPKQKQKFQEKLNLFGFELVVEKEQGAKKGYMKDVKYITRKS